jgi:hypothetical protein
MSDINERNNPYENLRKLTNSQKQEKNIAKILNTIEDMAIIFLAKFSKIQEYLDFPEMNLNLFYSILDSYSLAGQVNNNQFISFVNKLYKLKQNKNNYNNNIVNDSNNASNEKSISITNNVNSNNNLIDIENLNRRNSTKIINKNIFTEKFKHEKIENRLNNSSTNLINENKLNSQNLPRFNIDDNPKSIENSNFKLFEKNAKNKNENFENLIIENFDNKLEAIRFSESINLNPNNFNNNINENDKIIYNCINFNNKIETADSNSTIPIELTNNINLNNEKNNNNNYETNFLKTKEKETEIKIEENLSCNISMSIDDFIIKENKDYYVKSNNENFTTPFKGAGENISAFIPHNNNITLSFNSCLLSNNNYNKNLNSNFSIKKQPVNNFEIRNNSQFIKNKTFGEKKNYNFIIKASLIDTDEYEKISNLLKYFKSFSYDEHLFDSDFIFACLALFFEANLEERFLLVIQIFGCYKNNNDLENNRNGSDFVNINYKEDKNLDSNNGIAYKEFVYFVYNIMHFILHFSRELESNEIEEFPELSTQGTERENSDCFKSKSSLEYLKNNHKGSILYSKKENATESALNVLLKNECLMEMCQSLVKNFYDFSDKKYEDILDLESLINYADSLL